MSIPLVELSAGFRRVSVTAKGFRQFGVPLRGALDREAATLVRDQLGLPSVSETWELLSPRRERVRATSTVWCCFGGVGHRAMTGADRHPQMGSRFLLRDGEEVLFDPSAVGVPTYVGFAPEGSFAVPSPRPHDLGTDPVFAVMRSPDGLAQTQLFNQRFSVSSARDRTGIRLNGVCPAERPSLPSRPVVPGVIQVTSEDTLIVIGPDGPTIGGYPIWGTIIDVDLDRFFRMQTGIYIQFVPSA